MTWLLSKPASYPARWTDYCSIAYGDAERAAGSEAAMSALARCNAAPNWCGCGCVSLCAFVRACARVCVCVCVCVCLLPTENQMDANVFRRSRTDRTSNRAFTVAAAGKSGGAVLSGDREEGRLLAR